MTNVINKAGFEKQAKGLGVGDTRSPAMDEMLMEDSDDPAIAKWLKG